MPVKRMQQMRLQAIVHSKPKTQVSKTNTDGSVLIYRFFEMF